MVINMEQTKYRSFMELIKNVYFITINTPDMAKRQLLKDVSEGMHVARVAAKGSLKTRSAKFFFQ